jgi:DNA (cytosine-5)-methyltransferase 1
MQKTLDLFAGPGGWDVHDAELGLITDGVELDAAARATREAAGLRTVHDDVTTFKLRPGHGYTGKKASPPCQTFSAAGNGKGRRDLDVVVRELHRLAAGHPLDYAHFSDARTGLVLEPLRVVLDAVALGEPFRWLVLEQVPQVLPVWQEYAKVLFRLGYAVAVGNLHAEQYGVPQTRKRAVLVARLEGGGRVAPDLLPTPTHSKYYPHAPGRLDAGLLPWVPMADVLGWGMTARPAMTVTGGGTATGGAEPFGNAARKGIRRELAAGRWKYAGAGSTSVHTAGQQPRTQQQPAHTVTGKGTAAWVDEGKHAARVTVSECALLQTFPAGYPWQGGAGQQYQQVGNAIPPLLAKGILQQVV